MKHALIVGIDSVIGRALQQELLAAGWVVFGTTRRKEQINDTIVHLDLTQAITFRLEHPLDVVFLCASITSIAGCRDNPERSKQVNCDAQIILANYFLNRAIHVIFLSTNAVFSGQKPAYRIDDVVGPTTIYGTHKAMVEQELKNRPGKISIVRLSKVLTMDYPLIVRWIQALQQGACITPFHDMSLCLIALRDVTYCLKEIAERTLLGIIHLSGEKDVTYYDLAMHLAKSINADPTLVIPCSGFDAGISRAEAPPYASLDITESKKLFDMSGFPLEDLINEILRSPQ